MTLPSPTTIQAGRKAASRMADRGTPFIENEWYVAALTEEIGRSLTARTILGQRIVFYRKEDGAPVAMADRCAHRSYPLSAGTLSGDTIVCGYHGFRYDALGNWIEVPSQPKCPRNIGVRAYPLIEQGPLVWIWMGDAAAMDAAKLPLQEWITSSAWSVKSGYLHLPGNYVSLHENLLDLTHLSYIHAKSFGTPDYARAPYTVDIQGQSFAVTRRVIPTKLPPIWAKSTKLGDSETAARIARSEYISPGLHLTSTTFYETTLPPDQRQEYHARAAHFPTPETHRSTHYFVVDGRDFGLADETIGPFMHAQLMVAFREDVDALGRLEEVLADGGDDFYEISVASDAPAVAMRRHLRALSENQAAARTAVPQSASVAAE